MSRVQQAWVSPAIAALQTAAALGLQPATEAALRGCDYGRWTGLSLAAVAQQDGEAAVLRWLDDPAAAPHGGESTLDVLARAGRWLDSRAGGEAPEVAVTHADIVRAAVLHAMGAPPASYARIDAGPMTRVVLSYNRGWRLRAITPARGLR